jgi:UDP-N-acetylglucosamine 2-epimerase (non-hydrolysing)
MIDTLLRHIEIAAESKILDELSLRKGDRVTKYAAVTLHRPSNVDERQTLKGILDALNNISQRLPVILPAHPRTTKMIDAFNLKDMVNYKESISSIDREKSAKKVFVFPPMGYLDFLSLMSNAALVLTDSGGIQEETTILGIPCLTIRKNTERPITIKEGTNTLVGNDPEKILSTALGVLEKGVSRRKPPKYWDGKAAQRIAKVLIEKLEKL